MNREFICKVDELGKITIPAELMEKLDLKVMDKIFIYTEGNRIYLQKE